MIRGDFGNSGVVDLPTIQRYLNFHYSVTLDLFGADVSSNAATFYSTGLKGRFEEARIQDDHRLKEQTYPVLKAINGELATEAAPALNALNEKLRDDYIRDSVSGVARWNKIIQKIGLEFRLSVPHKGFQPADRRPGGAQSRSRWAHSQPGRLACQGAGVAAQRRRSSLCTLVDGPGYRSGEIRELDRTPGEGGQQEGRRFRIYSIRLSLCARPRRFPRSRGMYARFRSAGGPGGFWRFS